MIITVSCFVVTLSQAFRAYVPIEHKQFPVERFEAAVSQSAVPAPPHLNNYQSKLAQT